MVVANKMIIVAVMVVVLLLLAVAAMDDVFASGCSDYPGYC